MAWGGASSVGSLLAKFGAKLGALPLWEVSLWFPVAQTRVAPHIRSPDCGSTFRRSRLPAFRPGMDANQCSFGAAF